MKYASSFLQFIYGGKDLPQPDWLTIAIQKLQTMNTGYHWGRFINCIEVTLHAYKALLENKGVFFPNVTPLPSLPLFIPNYIDNVHSRMRSLDETKRSHRLWINKLNFAQFTQYLKENQVPVYSHLIIFAALEKFPGGHALSGFVVPNEAGTDIEVRLYDAQGFLPDAWLHPEQFDTFYSIDFCYVYDSEKTQNAVKTFIDECKSRVLNTSDNEKKLFDGKINDKLDLFLLREKLIEFIKIELFRLEAKLIIAPKQESKYLEDKFIEYHGVLGVLNNMDKNTHSLMADFFVKTAAIVKNHSYSYNWFNPQSLENFRAYFEKFIPLPTFQEPYTLETMTQYIALYLTHEIARLSMLNEYSNGYIDGKIDLYRKELNHLFSIENTVNTLKTRLEEIKKIASMTRHWLTMYAPATSSNLFDAYLKPLQEQVMKDHEIKTASYL